MTAYYYHIILFLQSGLSLLDVFYRVLRLETSIILCLFNETPTLEMIFNGVCLAKINKIAFVYLLTFIYSFVYPLKPLQNIPI